MPEKPAAEKTEQPTPRRLQKASEEGQVAQSEEFPAALTIAALAIAMAVAAPDLVKWSTGEIKNSLSCNTGCFVDTNSFTTFFGERMAQSILAMLPVLAAMMVASVFACITVSGINFSPKAISLKLDAISPSKGFAKLFDFRSVVKLILSVAKIVIVSMIVWFYISSRLDELTTLCWAYPSQLMTMIGKILLGIGIRISLALLVIAAVDVVYQKLKQLDQLKMTRQEVKQEMKDTDGSPEVKSRMRRIAMEMTRKRMMQEVPTATMILVNPTHVAVALKYDPKTMDSPVVVAKGADNTSAKIREIARAYGVPIIRRPSLARSLYATVKIGMTIPQDLYIAVAEVLAMIYRLKHRK
ncbi:MAG: flagellar biosynthesis protein FlhB [Anaerohalosphaera sp.]|nr:flagellar biosynthesis protein FlhB [Anaerohalosphaera sp.]